MDVHVPESRDQEFPGAVQLLACGRANGVSLADVGDATAANDDGEVALKRPGFDVDDVDMLDDEPIAKVTGGTPHPGGQKDPRYTDSHDRPQAALTPNPHAHPRILLKASNRGLRR